MNMTRAIFDENWKEIRAQATGWWSLMAEYDLLKALVTHPDKVLTHRMLLNLVWGGEQGTDAHYLHVYVGQLRRKIERDPTRPRHLLTEPGVGYRFRTG